jgi:RNA polymerase primary sigma factor
MINIFESGNFSLKERLGCEPSDEQLADSLRISRADLQSQLIQCSLAREKLAMSNVRLVMSIAQKNDNMGAEMADLVQVTFFCFTSSMKCRYPCI